jgi:hypothetical protein
MPLAVILVLAAVLAVVLVVSVVTLWRSTPRKKPTLPEEEAAEKVVESWPGHDEPLL